MSATLSYGGYSFPDNSVWLSITEREMKTQLGRRLGRQVVWDVGGVFSKNDGDIGTQIAAFESGTAANGSSLTFTTPNGGHSLSNGSTINGVRVVRRHYAKQNHNVWGSATEFVAGRSFQATFAGEVYDPEGEILVWHESVRLVAMGTQDFEIVESLQGYPESQITAAFTKSIVIQSGMAVGASEWPAVAPPIWPGWLKPRPVLVEYAEPQIFGVERNTMYPTRWSYRFEAPSGQIDSTFPQLAFS